MDKIHDLSIPFDNNASERLLRGVKKKLKQTGGFRSLDNGMTPNCSFLSIAQTASMRKMETLGVIRDIFEGKRDLFGFYQDNHPGQSL